VAYRACLRRVSGPRAGIALSVLAGVLRASFIGSSRPPMSADFTKLEAGKMGAVCRGIRFFRLAPVVEFPRGNSIVMVKPLSATRSVSATSGTATAPAPGRDPGGVIWSIGMSFSILASARPASPFPIGLGQGATMVAALWGVFIWKEFAKAPQHQPAASPGCLSHTRPALGC